MGSGDLLLFLCKEVSVLQQDCVYIETYIMAQLYAKLLLKFCFLWESVVQALLISVYCCFLPPSSLTDQSQLSLCFLFSTPTIPNTTFAYSSEGSGLRVGGPLKHLTKQSKAKQSKGSRAPLSTLVSFCSIPAAAAGDSFSLVFDKVLIAKIVLFSPCRQIFK